MLKCFGNGLRETLFQTFITATYDQTVKTKVASCLMVTAICLEVRFSDSKDSDLEVSPHFHVSALPARSQRPTNMASTHSFRQNDIGKFNKIENVPIKMQEFSSFLLHGALTKHTFIPMTFWEPKRKGKLRLTQKLSGVGLFQDSMFKFYISPMQFT